ncbi:hypothetical protein PVAP13_5NG451140 [Panicum virgatum]|uniref:Uncharacterized protein n=1 Tax=Panicum virgatum TaxID=38727 RepID=A0A8T0S189_PANVG|nr:hypothetical protein PVAP13_5NG451140 [Panicum virgatum]
MYNELVSAEAGIDHPKFFKHETWVQTEQLYWATSPAIISAARSFIYDYRRGQCGMLSASRLFVFPVADFSNFDSKLVYYRRLSLPHGFFPICLCLIRAPVFVTLLFPFDVTVGPLPGLLHFLFDATTSPLPGASHSSSTVRTTVPTGEMMASLGDSGTRLERVSAYDEKDVGSLPRRWGR